VATVFCDDNKKYLSTDLMKEEPVKLGYLTPEIELLRYEALPRALTDAQSYLINA
jgi:cysteine synthase A